MLIGYYMVNITE